MATSQPSYHARSNSLPSRQHPIASQIDETLNRLRSSQSACTSTSVGQKLHDVQDLHEGVHMLLQLPLTQQALAQSKCIEELLDGSLMVLDECSIAKDALLKTKECTQQLQSILRRRRGVEGIACEVRKYLTCRNTVRKAISKALKNLKHMKINKNGENGAEVSILREVEAATVSVLESLLSFVSGSEAASKLNRWSLVSKLIHQKRVACEEEDLKANEIANAEAKLLSFIKSENVKHIENVQNELQTSEMCIQDLEEGVESLYRRLVKTRVTILNIINC